MGARQQFIRFALVGFASNLLSYALYIALTKFGLDPKLSMTLLYCTGVLQTFFFNKKWSFRFEGAARSSLIRYVIAYALGYFINLAALVLLVDGAKFPHQLVQAVMIFIVAAMLFLVQRYWVFPQPKKRQMP
jgi:putative flippase GtrA